MMQAYIPEKRGSESPDTEIMVTSYHSKDIWEGNMNLRPGNKLPTEHLQGPTVTGKTLLVQSYVRFCVAYMFMVR